MSDAAPQVPDGFQGDVGLDAVEALLREEWGLSGQVFPVQEGAGQTYLIDNGHLRYLLEVRMREDEAHLRFEHEAMRHVTRSPDGPMVPEPISSRDGADLVVSDALGDGRLLRLLTVLDGAPSPLEAELSDAALSALGAMAASLARSLSDFHTMPENYVEGDDLRKAGPRTVELLSQVTDQEARDVIARAMVAALRRVHPLTPEFRLGLTLSDLPLDSLVGAGQGKDWLPLGLSDLAPLGRHWLVATVAKICAHVLALRAGDPFSILPVAAAYHAIYPLNEPELEALWPLTIANAALDAATAQHRLVLTPQDEVAVADAGKRLQVIKEATSITAIHMHAAILNACGVEPMQLDFGALVPDIEPETIALVDLSVASPLLYDGNWTDPECDWKLLAREAWATKIGSTRYGECRLSRTSMDDAGEPESFALHVDICLPAGTTVSAPFSGRVMQIEPRLCLKGPQVTLIVEGVAAEVAEGSDLQAGERLGLVAGTEGAVGGLRLRLSRDPDSIPPLFCRPTDAGIWRHLAPSPSALLRLYADPPHADPSRLVRAWREYLFDHGGRALLDFSGEGPSIGHCHPAIATAVYRQHLLVDAAAVPFADLDALRQAYEDAHPPGLPNAFLFTDRAAAMEAIDAVRTIYDSWKAGQLVGEVSLEGEQDPDGPSTILVVEPMPGRDGLAAQAAAARSAGQLVVADEARTGFGRLGRFTWGVEREEITADLLLAGSLDGGSVTAVYCNDDLAETLRARERHLSPLAAASALAAIQVWFDEQLQANAEKVGQVLEVGLQALARPDGPVRQIRGAGLLWELQLSDEVANPTALLRGSVVHASAEDHALFLCPPLCVSEASAASYLERLHRAFKASGEG